MWSRLILCLLLQTIGLIFFLKGFFPQKAISPGFAKFDTLENPFHQDGEPQFKTLILVVVDAMRADFMYSSTESLMSFLHGLIKTGEAIPFTAFSNPPTVTLPRLKGITTGGTPNFIDAILNIADENDNSQSLSETDSWLYQFKKLAGGRVMHFFGDDTWLKLFPPAVFFEKYEGTNSFFVSDFTEVDLNVTRHLEAEVNDTQWNGLILHYLGLDHIGHKGGPQSIFMKSKQEEMDDVLKKLYETRVATSNSTLLVLMGDHGMNERGNHGGSSDGETSPGMAFIAPKFKRLGAQREAPISSRLDFKFYSQVAQIDLVPTLSTLFGFPIPVNNLGVVIPELLDIWAQPGQRARMARYNCQQLLNLLRLKHVKDTPVEAQISLELSTIDEVSSDDVQAYFDLSKKIQTLLADAATNYNYFEIGLGLTLTLVSFILLVSVMVTLVTNKRREVQVACAAFAFFSLLYSLHFHGSSLIEEEHQLWWFLTIIVLCMSQRNRLQRFLRGFVSLVLVRIIRGWNNSGQKFSTLTTWAQILLDRPHMLWILTIGTYAIISFQIFTCDGWTTCFRIDKQSLPTYKSDDYASLITFIITYVITSLSFLFKLSQFHNDGNEVPKWLNFILRLIRESFGVSSLADKLIIQELNIQLSNLFVTCLLIMMGARIILGKLRSVNENLAKSLLRMSTLYLLHQSRVENIPIFAVFVCLNNATLSTPFPTFPQNEMQQMIWDTMLVLCIQNLSFFSIGNTNLLATVDLSNAYNGISEYDIPRVTFLTFVSNFAVAIYWSFTAIDYLADLKVRYTPNSEGWNRARSLLPIRFCFTLAFYLLSAINLMGSCINLRFHLFVWSVFSPKLLFFASWSLLMNLVVDVIFCSLILSI